MCLCTIGSHGVSDSLLRDKHNSGWFLGDERNDWLSKELVLVSALNISWLEVLWGYSDTGVIVEPKEEGREKGGRKGG